MRATPSATHSSLVARASVAVERAETLDRERNIASTLQKASLPTIIPQSEGLQFDAVYLPAGQQSEVGGDWYDAIELDDGSVVVSVGDVTQIAAEFKRAIGTGKDAPSTTGVDILGWDFAFELNEVAKQQAAAANTHMRFRVSGVRTSRRSSRNERHCCGSSRRYSAATDPNLQIG